MSFRIGLLRSGDFPRPTLSMRVERREADGRRELRFQRTSAAHNNAFRRVCRKMRA